MPYYCVIILLQNKSFSMNSARRIAKIGLTLKLFMRKQIDGATLSGQNVYPLYLQDIYRWQVVSFKVFIPYLQLLCLFR